MCSVYFGGSRVFNSSNVVFHVVKAALLAGHSVRVGCSVGADSAVIKSVLSLGFSLRLHVFAIGTPSGQGFLPAVSACGAVRMAKRSGALVSWLAGGSLAVPARARLAVRTRQALSGARLACFFLSPGASASGGSLQAAAQAVRRGLSTFVFSCGFGQPPALQGLAGRWVRSSLWGFPCWFWWVAQKSLFPLGG